ncbi:MAG: hypothetical protein ACI8P0_005082 [Planctomycetaceae bacterium]|jgi:hypothetical protein
MTLTLVVRTEPPTGYLIKPDRDTFTICSAIVIGDPSDGRSLFSIVTLPHLFYQASI